MPNPTRIVPGQSSFLTDSLASRCSRLARDVSIWVLERHYESFTKESMNHCRKSVRKMGVVMLTSLALVTVGMFWNANNVPTASALCNPGPPAQATYAWVGQGRYSAPFDYTGGVYAVIDNYDPFAYSAVQTFVQLVYDNPQSIWMKAGWSKTGGAYTGPRRVFREYWLPSTGYGIEYYQSVASIPYSYYTVLYHRYDSNPRWQVNTQFASTDFGGWLNWGPYLPTLAQISGQTEDRQAQMPGGGQQPVNISNASFYVNGSWQAFGGSGFNSDSSIYGNLSVSPSFFQIWDWRCSL